MAFTSRSRHHFVATGKAVRKASHCVSRQTIEIMRRDHSVIARVNKNHDCFNEKVGFFLFESHFLKFKSDFFTFRVGGSHPCKF